MDYKNKLFKIWMFIRNNWLKLVLGIGTIAFIFNKGAITFILAFVLSTGILLSLILENYHINNAIRFILNMRVEYDTEKTKRKNNEYENRARKEAFKVERFDKNN